MCSWPVHCGEWVPGRGHKTHRAEESNDESVRAIGCQIVVWWWCIRNHPPINQSINRSNRFWWSICTFEFHFKKTHEERLFSRLIVFVYRNNCLLRRWWFFLTFFFILTIYLGRECFLLFCGRRWVKSGNQALRGWSFQFKFCVFFCRISAPII